MLVLTRKAQERIQIGNEITISILKVKGNSVRVGIEAPAHVRIVRSELPRFEAEGAEPGTTPGEAADLADSSLRDLVRARLSQRPSCAPVTA